jgi:hypothetical protein
MAAKGSKEKDIVTNKILETFNSSFVYSDKTIRIPVFVDGDISEVKVALTVVKTPVGQYNALDGGIIGLEGVTQKGNGDTTTQPTQQEIDYLYHYLKLLDM